MRKNLFTSICGLLFILTAAGQNFSNKGTDFWTGYGPHEKISSGGSDMTLYFTSEDTATVSIYIGNAIFQTLSLAAGTITASNNIPESGALDARLQNEQIYVNKGIYIHSTSPIVAYAQIWGSQVTATTILFPEPTLGRTYTALNYTQLANVSGMRSYTFIVATEDGTQVEVKPRTGSNTVTVTGDGNWHTAPQILNKGDVWLLKGGSDVTDLTGLQIRSVSGANGTCKPIAVFSGSQKIYISCAATGSAPSSDNLFQQAFPMVAWGKKYVTAPTALTVGTTTYENNVFRVMINPDSPATVVKVNNVILPGTVPGLSPAVSPLTPGAPINLTNGLYYEFVTKKAATIETTSPVMVAQYISNKDKCGNNFGGGGDPDMVYLSPVEQTIDKIIVSPVPTENGATNYLNVVMKTVDVPNFSIRNQSNALVPASFIPVAIDPTYSYAQVTLVPGYSPSVYYKLQTTTGGFNAIAYGYASSESYAYNAGTNVKNLNQVLTSSNPLGSGTTKICKGTPTNLSVALSYIPTTMTWQFFSNPLISPNADVTIINPVPVNSYVNANGTTLYVFNLPGLYTFNATGNIPLRVLANNPTPDGCNGLEQIDFNVTAYGSPTSNFNWTFSGCGTNPVSFHDLSTDTVSTVNRWSWDFGDGTGVSAAQNPTYVYGTGGSFNVTLRAIDAEGCYKDSTRTFVIAGTPIVNFTHSGTGCTGNTITFTDASTVSPGTLVKWYWDYGDGTRDTVYSNAPLTHIYTTGGTYTVTLKVENATGCAGTNTATLVIGNTPVADFSLPATVCLPGPAQFTNLSSVAGGGPLGYSWDFGDLSASSNAVSPVHNYANTGPFTVILTATSGSCSKSATKIFNTLYFKPLADFSVAAENCLNDVTAFTDLSTSVSSTVNGWKWFFGDGNGSPLKNPTHIYAAAGTYTVKLVVTATSGCESDTMIKTVVINQLPVASFTISSPACEQQSVTITNTSTSANGTIAQWFWDFGDGTKDTLSTGSPFTHVYGSGGSYTIKLKVKSSKGCVSSVYSLPIAVNATPKPGFSVPAPLCLPGTISFGNSTTISDATLPQVTYSWNFGDGSPVSNATNPLHNYATGGIYTIKLTATSAAGCAKDSIKDIAVYNTPVSGYTVAAGAVCSNLPLQITNTAAVTGYGTVNKVEVYWDYLNDPLNKSVDNAPVTGGTYSHQYPVFGSPLTKTYRVLLRAYSGSGCSNDYFQDIVINAAPQVQLTAIPSVCQEVPGFVLTQGSETGGIPGSGLYSGAGIAASPFFVPQQAGAGVHVIRYTYTSTNGCSSFAEQNLEVYATPLVNLGPDLKVLEGDAVQLQPQVSGNGLSYLWSPATYLDNVTVLNAVSTPKLDITYRLLVTSADGCSASDDVFLKVIRDFTVPNTFTPNNDGINDLWLIDNLDLYPNHRVEVFNRYGQLVFSTKDYTKPWDGTYKGKPLPVGTYYYIIELGGQRKPKTGYVTIIK